MKYDLTDINRLVLQKHHLTMNSKSDDLVQIAYDLCGLHSTDPTTPYLSLLARTTNFTRAQLDNELYIHKTLGKIRCMRKTLFMLPKKLIPVAFNATNMLVEDISGRHLEYRGVSVEQYLKISKKVMDLLKGRELSTNEMKKIIKTDLDLSAILNFMCDQGLLIRSSPVKSWKDRRNKYAILKEFFQDMDLIEQTRESALKELLIRYIITYGPVTEKDIVWWLGIKKSEVLETLNSIKSQIHTVKIGDFGNQFFIFEKDRDKISSLDMNEDTINLLPQLDPYIMGYKERARYLEFKDSDYIFDRSGNGTSTILLNGKIVGVWDLTEKPYPTVKFLLFRAINQKSREKIYLESKKFGNFITDKKVEVKECKGMIPLTSRTVGSFMSPLKNCED